ncbi:MAG: hypothetical protein R3245_02055, partial [Kiloniellales bacterium]|nr:hypothetical protein [Kiloniellales bacterium]
RINAMILCNPFVETEEGKAKTILRYYYLRRLLDRSFWKKVFSLRFNIVESLRSMLSLGNRAFGSASVLGRNGTTEPGMVNLTEPLPQQMPVPQARSRWQRPQLCARTQSKRTNSFCKRQTSKSIHFVWPSCLRRH